MNESSRYNAVIKRIRETAKASGRNADEVSLVAVSKTYPASQIRLMAAAGAEIFGESRMQEAKGKLEELKDLSHISFHFIGRLQTNKVKQVVGNFVLIHSVDRLRLAKEINSVAKQHGIVQDVLIQLNPAGEEQKGGIAEDEAESLIKEVLEMDGLRLRGFMLIPPFDVEPEQNRPLFRKMKEFFDSKKVLSPYIDTLSMGMSDDFEIAVQEGSTMVRVGTALFGKRQ